MVQLLYANSTDIAMAGPRRTIYVTGHAKLNSIDLQRFRNDIGNLNMALDMLILGDNEQVALHFISLVLSQENTYYLLNYSRLSAGDPNVGVKVDKLQDDQNTDKREVMLRTEPAEVQDFVQDDGGLDSNECECCLLSLRARLSNSYT